MKNGMKVSQQVECGAIRTMNNGQDEATLCTKYKTTVAIRDTGSGCTTKASITHC